MKLPAKKPINLPDHSPGDLFKGREDELEKLYRELATAQSWAAAIIGNTIYGYGMIIASCYTPTA